MLGMYLERANRHTPRHVRLQHMDRGEKRDVQKVGGGRRRKAQDSQAAKELERYDLISVRVHSGHTGMPEISERGTGGGRVGEGKRGGLELG